MLVIDTLLADVEENSTVQAAHMARTEIGENQKVVQLEVDTLIVDLEEYRTVHAAYMT